MYYFFKKKDKDIFICGVSSFGHIYVDDIPKLFLKSEVQNIVRRVFVWNESSSILKFEIKAVDLTEKRTDFSLEKMFCAWEQAEIVKKLKGIK